MHKPNITHTHIMRIMQYAYIHNAFFISISYCCFFNSLLALLWRKLLLLLRFMQRLYQRFITPCIDYITEGLDDSRKQTPLNTVIRQTSLNMLTQFCHAFDAMYPASPLSATDDADDASASTSDNDDQRGYDVIECGFIEVREIEKDFS